MDESDPADPYTVAGQEAAKVVASEPEIEALAAAGMSTRDIAETLNLPVKLVRRSRATLVPLTDEHDKRVERALYEAASSSRTFTAERLDRNGTKHTLQAEVLPDSRAALAYLERRRPDQWADKRPTRPTVILLTPDELIALKQRPAIEGTSTDVTPDEGAGARAAGGEVL